MRCDETWTIEGLPLDLDREALRQDIRDFFAARAPEVTVRFPSEPKTEAEPDKEDWFIQWRLASWPFGSWTRIEAVSREDAVQKGRKVYRMRLQEGEHTGLALQVVQRRPWDDAEGFGRTRYTEASEEITQYPRVIFGPVQEPTVGAGVPVWRIVEAVQNAGLAAHTPYEERKRANAVWTRLGMAPGAISIEDIEDALDYYGDHADEIDAVIAARRG